MRVSDPNSPPFFLWQALAAVLMGILTGALLFNLTNHARAALPNLATPMKEALAGKPAAAPVIPVLPNLDKRMVILLMGVDSNGPNCQRYVGTRSDTMMLASIDPQTKQVGLISIPRDSRVIIPRGHGFSKINSAHALGGPTLAKEAVENNFDVNIDHYVVIDTVGLKKVCEFLGPCEVLVEKEMHYVDHTAKLNVDLKPGLHTLSPVEMEEYVRFRHDPRGDIGRMERQQWFLRQVAHKLKEPQVLLRLPELMGLANEFVSTDLSLDEMARLLSFGREVEPHQIVTATLPGEGAMIGGISYWLPDMKASRIAIDRLVGTNTELAADPSSPTAPEAVNTNKPIRVSIRYPRGCEKAADYFETKLTEAGYKVRYKWRVDEIECRHEEIIANSSRANQENTNELRRILPQMEKWPTVVSPESRSYTDFTLVISPNVMSAMANLFPAPSDSAYAGTQNTQVVSQVRTPVLP
ncbi:MAG: LCP family protein [Candidatus Obscuribacterales bacterium]|nr:LCP family protein [Candidatus Obscuribacterales bacterium]